MKNKLLKNMLYAGLALFFALFLTTACSEDEPEEEEIIVEDGLYIKGGATAVDELSYKGMMSVARNEVTQENRSSLYEKYIAISNSSEGFSIIHVNGSSKATYGPGSDYGISPSEWETDEPDVDFYRGSYTETETVFTVSESGLYHIAIDVELGVVVVVPVEWGVIGAATPTGWSASTPLTSSAFDLDSMTFSATDMQLSANEFKFRHSDGWKVDLDTNEVVTDDGDKGVKINTNFGGSISALVAGGDNITMAESGYYTVIMTWTLDDGHTASMEKTADVALTDWTGVVLDIVGTGVSSDNATATADASSWNWGNVMIADNSGVPTANGDLYTWTWSDVILVENEGFKVRTLDGVAPETNGANFDAGLESVDYDNSSANVTEGGSGNLSVTVGGTYDITIVIDASADDAKTITITDAE